MPLLREILGNIWPANIRLDEDVLKTSWRLLSSCLQKTSSRRPDEDEYILINHTSSKDVFKTSLRRLGQDQYIRLVHASSRRLQDVFKTSSRRLQDVIKTSSRRLANTSWRPLANTSWRHLQDVLKTYHQVKLFLLTSRSIQHVVKTYCKDCCLQKDSPRSHFWEIYGKCTKFARVIKISQVLVFQFTTPFSGCI